MTTEAILAVYQDGVLKPLNPLNLPNQQKVVITLEAFSEPTPENMLQAWQSVYEGLEEEDIAEVEAIALDRDNFMLRGGE